MNNNHKIKNIKKRIESLKKPNNTSNDKFNKKNGLSFGFRIGVEIVATIIVGTAIGVFVDKYLGTKPFGLIIFFILGALAGFLNIYRVMHRIENQ